MLNKQGPSKIDWTDYTWNPISGCLHSCPYCYMRRMETRFKGIMKPKFHKSRLEDAAKLKSPSKIFVGSSGDMWGEWVDHYWIHAVFWQIKKYPQHTFQFLTKNPGKYEEFNFDGFENCWFGTTDDGSDKTEDNISLLIESMPAGLKFVSFEPLLVGINPDLTGLDWVIIGANSNRGADKAPDRWADKLIKQAIKLKIPVWVKDNYRYHTRIKEFPIKNG